MKENRVAGAIKKLEKMGLSQMLVTDPMSIYYFTGKMFHPGERFLALYLSANGAHTLYLNRLFFCQEELGVEKVWMEDTEDIVGLLKKTLDSASPLGVDKDMPARFLLPLMDGKAADSFVNGSPAIDGQKACKDEEEQAAMILSSQINDKAMAEFKKLIQPGVTEKEIAAQMPDIYIECGGDQIDFGIVAFGKNAADPHHGPDDTVLQEGDAVLLDVGCKKDGYCSDMTRTFFFRRAAEKAKEVYEIVKNANLQAEKAVRPGVRFCDIDKVARDYITERGYGEYFTHRLGHSIGMQCHEAGDVSAANQNIIEEGMTFSIEPGIYLPGEVGVRVEDLVLVTKGGCRVLNSYSKELEIL